MLDDINTGSVSRATIERLLRDRIKHVRSFSSTDQPT